MKSTATNDNNLWVAAGDGQLDRIKELVEGGAQVNARDEFGYTAMHAAVSYNHKNVLEYLLEHGGDINIEDFDKDTPLYVCEHVDMAKFLVDRGANVHHKNSEGISPAQTANEEGWTDVASYLASVTGENLEQLSDDDDENEKALAHIQQDDDDDDDDDTALRPEFARQVEQLMHKIQQEGGVHDEEELRQVVTNMVLEQVKQSMNGDSSS